MQKYLLVTIFFLAVLGIQTSFAQEIPRPMQSTDPGMVVRAFYDALNNSDVDGALEWIADEAMVVHIPSPPGVDNAIDKTGLEEFWRQFVARNGYVEITELYVHGNRVALIALVWEDFLTSLGIAPAVTNVTAVVHGGKVRSYTVTFSDESESRLVEAMRRVENQTVVDRLYEEVMNQKDLSVLDEIFATDVTDHDNPDQQGLEAIKAGLDQLLQGLPDLQVTVEHLLVAEDKVVSRVTFRGTHQGEWLDVAPTGNQVEWTHIDIHRLEGGVITDVWHVVPVGMILQQLGFELVPSS